ncbi:MAG: NifU N-terminal domain-containing protein [Candidatus Promineifilaceae bacterium]|nr:NifU N-terminal domain-containing protein [Candidatus Promineifilaceae bacterium]
MSEYIEIETELSDDPAVLRLVTNLPLTEGEPELYESSDQLDEGSPVAQALAPIEGIQTVHIQGSELTIMRDMDMPAHIIVAEVTAALKEFFL